MLERPATGWLLPHSDIYIRLNLRSRNEVSTAFWLREILPSIVTLRLMGQIMGSDLMCEVSVLPYVNKLHQFYFNVWVSFFM